MPFVAGGAVGGAELEFSAVVTNLFNYQGPIFGTFNENRRTGALDQVHDRSVEVAAAEHPLLSELPEGSPLRADVAQFVERVKASARNRSRAGGINACSE